MPQAIAARESLVADLIRLRGPGTRNELAVRSTLASAHSAEGRLNDADALPERTLADYKRVLGPDHPDSALVRQNLNDARYEAPGRKETS